MMYDIQMKNDISSGAVLTVRFPEEDIDKKSLYTIQSDQPEFLVPFLLRNVDGYAECTYQLGMRSELRHRFGSHPAKEYVKLWTNILQPLLDCDDWFLKPSSFVLDANYLYVDRSGSVVSYIYVPSKLDFMEAGALKAMVNELSNKNSTNDQRLENHVWRALAQDFNPRNFLQMLSESNPSPTPEARGHAEHVNPPKQVVQYAEPSPVQQGQSAPAPTLAPSPSRSSDIEISIEPEKKKKKGLFGSKKERPTKKEKAEKKGFWDGKSKENQIILGAAGESAPYTPPKPQYASGPAPAYVTATDIVSAVLVALFLTGGICTFTGLRQMERAQAEAAETARLAEEAARAAEEAERIAKQALAAVTDSEAAYRQGDIPTAISSALEALSLDSPYAAQAQKSLTDALGIYDLSDGFKSHLLLELPSEPLKVELSPSGTRVGVMASGKMLVFDTVNGSQLAELPAGASVLSDLAFIGENLVLFAGDSSLTAYDLASGSVRWTGAAATGISVSGDGSKVAAIYRDENQAAVYDAVSGDVLKVVSFTNQHQEVAANDVFVDTEDSLFTLNEDGTLLAVSFADGTLTVFDLRTGGDDLTIFDGSDFTQFEGGFYERYLAFAAKGNGLAAFAVIDAEKRQQTGGFSSERVSYHTQTDKNGIYISSENLLVKLHPLTGEQSELAYIDSDITAFDISGGYAVTATRDGACSFFGPDATLLEKREGGGRCDFVRIAGETAVTANLDSPVLLVQRLEQHPETQIFSYDADYDHHEARVSADSSTVMLFRYNQFRLYEINGVVLAETEIPDAGQVYDQQYRRDESGDRLEVIYNNGLVRAYSAKDGSLLSEEQGEAPDRTLYEEFTTNHLRIERPLHGTPVAYDKESGELVRELESNAYLTYVTEVDGYIVTEYMTAQGERYGLLLNENLDTLARLPNLCDITADGHLVFDDMRGNLRQSRIYSIQELMALAKTEGGNT